MTKIHYEGVLCGAKSWTEKLAEGVVITVTSEGTKFDRPVDIASQPLPQTDDWSKVTCKRCLTKKEST